MLTPFFMGRAVTETTWTRKVPLYTLDEGLALVMLRHAGVFAEERVWMVGWLRFWGLVGWLRFWGLVGWLVGWLRFRWLVGWLVGWLVEILVDLFRELY